jgi:hypothetical protein
MVVVIVIGYCYLLVPFSFSFMLCEKSEKLKAFYLIKNYYLLIQIFQNGAEWGRDYYL